LRKSLSEAQLIAEALLGRAGDIERAGFDLQVQVRRASPLVFFHPLRAQGARFRLEPLGSSWSFPSANAPLSTDELLQIMEAEPLRFSTSALLRPVVQDSLLPTAAYVAGPGEINYFAQLPPVYELFEVSMPLLVPRARFRCIEPRTKSLLDKLALSPADAERPRDELRRALGARTAADYPPPDVVKDRLMDDFSRQLDGIEASVEALDRGLRKSIVRTRATVGRAISRFSERYGRALLERDRISTDRVDRLLSLLCPGGVPQERYDSLPYFACRYGRTQLKERIFASLDPFAGDIRDIQL
jgi:uncharacterized protein YllA (UPF0747 family)